jgi:thiol:disulfide interchange protein DsbC
MVVFAPEKTKHTVTVFTDIDCPYCVRFHQQVPELNENGVKVRYLAFPRSGVDSAAYRKAVSVWCAEDRSRAMTDAKAGRNVPEKSCDNPVGEHFETGRALGITGTPTLVLDNGKVVPGYVPTNQLIAALNGARPR